MFDKCGNYRKCVFMGLEGHCEGHVYLHIMVNLNAILSV